MTIGTKVNGTYFGVKYSGVVKGFGGGVTILVVMVTIAFLFSLTRLSFLME